MIISSINNDVSQPVERNSKGNQNPESDDIWKQIIMKEDKRRRDAGKMSSSALWAPTTPLFRTHTIVYSG